MNVIEQLKVDEGLKLKAYRCTQGVLTIGYGHTGDVHEGDEITLHQAEVILLLDIEKHKKELDEKLPWVHKLDDARYGVLLNMAFNMGINGLLKFKNTLKNVEAGKYADAGAGMMDSLWAKQVGNRAKRLSMQMITGVWK